MIREIVNNIPVLVISIIATITGGSAVGKVAQTLNPDMLSDHREVREVQTSVPTDSVTPTVTPTPSGTILVESPIPTITTKPTTTTKPKTSVASTTQFTLATLKTHNTQGNCFVAYNGVVYDVANSAAWAGCTHHGVHGGTDITSIFPHSTSYFSTLKKVGTLTGGSTPTGTGGNHTGDDDSDDSGEDEGIEIED